MLSPPTATKPLLTLINAWSEARSVSSPLKKTYKAPAPTYHPVPHSQPDSKLSVANDNPQPRRIKTTSYIWSDNNKNL